jgi:geranylgeranyl diphosphate synthase type I
LEGRGASTAARFEALLSLAKKASEQRLERAFAARLAARAALGPEVRAVLEAARDLSLRGGKRFRAALVVSAYRGVAPEARLAPAFAAGAALELLQSYLLVQDDWMDGDVERRGGPSVHVALESALGQGKHPAAVGAMLASDLLWGMALAELLGSGAEPRALVLACQEFARFHDDVVTGQILDGLAHGAEIEALHALKTGSYTVEGPLTLGAALAGAEPKVLTSLRRFAAPLGLAFQLRDDLLGVFGTEAESGRPVGSDLRAGKLTSVVSLALTRADAPSKRAIEGVLGMRRPTRAALERARHAI